MIGALTGTVEMLIKPHVLVDVNGVGYKVLVSDGLFAKLSPKQKTKLFIYTSVKEDAIDLFGFEDPHDLKLFENLISVSGIGPRTALNIFSFGTREAIEEAVVKSDTSFFTSVPRLGTKNAQRIIIELKGKLGSSQDLDLSGAEQLENDQVVQALRNFGFTQDEARKALKDIKTHGLKTEDKIRLALKNLARK